MVRLLPATAAVAAAFLCACPGHDARRPYPEPTVEDLLLRLAATRDQVQSFNAVTVMDYWLGDDRVKGDVLVMGTTGSKVRINALSPAGGDPISDLACDGADYVYLDIAKNCMTAGPCSRDTIASLFHVALAPDDFVQLAVGTTPIVPGATGTVTWDGKNRREVLELKGTDGRTQTIVLDARDGHADVVSSEVKGPDGTQEWRIDNSGISTVKDAAGMERRVPDKSRFRSPGDKSDLLVEWKERALGQELSDDKFRMTVPPNTPTCGR